MSRVERSRAEPIAIALTVLLILPVVALIMLGASADAAGWPQLINTVLPGMLWETVFLCFMVGAASLVVGTALAWLVTFYQFPLRAVLSWMAVLPLAIPAYITAFVMVDTFAYAGPIQTALRGVFGWATPAQSYLPDIRNHWGAAFILTLALYPYVYLSARAGFLKQSMRQVEVARTLGRSPMQAFLQITLPQARPALAVGVSLVIMECLNDIGAVGFFGVTTLTSGIYATWLEKGDLATASQLAVSMILCLGFLLWFEQAMRQRDQAARLEKNTPPISRSRLTNWRAFAAATAVSLPPILGFILPVGLLIDYADNHWWAALDLKLGKALWHSLALAVMACFAALSLALLFAYVARGRHLQLLTWLKRFATLGYAIPGTVLALGILIPLGAFDRVINTAVVSIGGNAPGLFLSGSIAALILAYVIRFLVMATGSVDAGLDKVSLHLDHVARTLGRAPARVFREIHLPLLSPALLSAALLITVDTLKELPATLLLRPFDFETLATHVYSLATLGLLEDSAVPALVIVAAGLVPVVLLTRGLREQK